MYVSNFVFLHGLSNDFFQHWLNPKCLQPLWKCNVFLPSSGYFMNRIYVMTYVPPLLYTAAEISGS